MWLKVQPVHIWINFIYIGFAKKKAIYLNFLPLATVPSLNLMISLYHHNILISLIDFLSSLGSWYSYSMLYYHTIHDSIILSDQWWVPSKLGKWSKVFFQVPDIEDFTSEPTHRIVLEDDLAIVLAQIPPFLWNPSFYGLKLGLGVGEMVTKRNITTPISAT